MKPFIALFKREFNNSFLSLSGALAAGLFMMMAALFLWILPGEYNIPANGYAEFGGFFRLLMNLLMFIVPVWTMRSFAEEFRSGSWELLRSRPITLRTILWSKWLALWLGILILLLLMMSNVVIASFLTQPIGNVDYRAALAAFIALATAAAAFVAFGMIASFVVRHAIGAVFVALTLNAVWVYGWDWLQMIPSLNSSSLLSALSLTQQTRMLFDGMMDSRALIYMALLTIITIEATTLLANGSHLRRTDGTLTAVCLVLLLANHLFFVRIDLTADQRFSLSHYSQQLLHSKSFTTRAHLFLDGKLNSGFQRLRQSTIDLIDECNQQSENKIYYSIDNPFRLASDQSTEKLIERMIARGLNGINVNERDAEGTLTQQRIFPYLLLTNETDSVWVNLLNNNPNLSGSKNLNNSIQEVEYRLMNALSQLHNGGTDKIVFIDGHGEDDEPHITSALDLLSEHYHIDRGPLPPHPETLADYRSMVIASPRTPFNEREKFIIDSYLQSGGTLFLLIDVAQLSTQQLYTQGECTAVATNHNLDDLLFHYGVRINNRLLLDVQCATIPIISDNSTDATPAPWYYAPVLFPTDKNSISTNIPPLRAEFCGTIDWIGTPSNHLRHTLYSSSSHTAHLPLPTVLSMAVTTISPQAEQFNQPASPAIVLIEGKIPSAFRNRLSPIDGTPVNKQSTAPTKIIIAASGALMRNDVEPNNEGHLNNLPLGQDRYTGTSYGNADFVLNALHYLCGKSELMQLRNRSVALRILDKQRTLNSTPLIQILSFTIPALLYTLLLVILSVIRKRKYTT